jgi:hypothetical protein
MVRPRECVAIAVPVSNRPGFTPAEEASLRQLEHYLGAYPRFFIAPPGLRIGREGFGVKRFPDRYFGSVDAHTQLMLSRRFYRTFRRYEFVLLYHLDALVFSDDLESWCDRGFDYVGAPWLASADDPAYGFAGVGNGGLSLRRVEAFLKVLRSRRYKEHPAAFWDRYHANKPLSNRLKNLPKRWLKQVRRLNGVAWETRHWRDNEDKFWSKRATHYDPEFDIAPVEVALEFAFECAPRYCFERSGRSLPFGCHAWERYDREFWEPHLVADGAGDDAAREAGKAAV